MKAPVGAHQQGSLGSDLVGVVPLVWLGQVDYSPVTLAAGIEEFVASDGREDDAGADGVDAAPRPSHGLGHLP